MFASYSVAVSLCIRLASFVPLFYALLSLALSVFRCLSCLYLAVHPSCYFRPCIEWFPLSICFSGHVVPLPVCISPIVSIWNVVDHVSSRSTPSTFFCAATSDHSSFSFSPDEFPLSNISSRLLPSAVPWQKCPRLRSLFRLRWCVPIGNSECACHTATTQASV